MKQEDYKVRTGFRVDINGIKSLQIDGFGLKTKISLLRNILVSIILIPTLCFSIGESPKSINNSGNLEQSIFQIQREIMNTLERMIEAYKNKNLSSFMSFVAEDYTGERLEFEWTIRRDFSNFHNMEIRYSINNITIDSTGRYIQVGLNFTRTYLDRKTGKSVKTNGQSILIFKIINNRAKLYSMRQQNIFGISK